MASSPLTSSPAEGQPMQRSAYGTMDRVFPTNDDNMRGERGASLMKVSCQE